MIFAWSKIDFWALINRGELFFGGGDSIYRHREVKRGEEMGSFRISKLKLWSFKVALRLLSPCSQVALFQSFLVGVQAGRNGKGLYPGILGLGGGHKGCRITGQ